MGGEGDNRGGDGWMASPTQWVWVWASSRRWWRTEKPGMLQSMGSQRVGHDLATEQQPPPTPEMFEWAQQEITGIICRRSVVHSKPKVYRQSTVTPGCTWPCHKWEASSPERERDCHNVPRVLPWALAPPLSDISSILWTAMQTDSIFKNFIYLFIWLCWVLVAACGIEFLNLGLNPGLLQ